MSQRVLFVDDDPNILAGFVRSLRKRYDMDTALGGEEGLQFIAQKGPYAVIVADMRMPGMDGVEFLAKSKAAAPSTVRMMLTGNADQGTAIEAVNQGSIFRFLNKPCEIETLAFALDAGIRQYQLITAERELLENTLKGSIEMLVELLSLLDPEGFGRAQSVSSLAQKVAKVMELEAPWILGIASVLSQIGVLTIPAQVVVKARSGGLLTSKEREIFNRVPEIGANLIRNIPRMDEVSQVILYTNKNYNGTGFPFDAIKEEDIPLGARVLRVVADYQSLLEKRLNSASVLSDMRQKPAWYDQRVLNALSLALDVPDTILVDEGQLPHNVTLEALKIGNVLVEGIETHEGVLVVPGGTCIGPAHLERLRNFERLVGLKAPFLVVGSSKT